MCEIDMGSKAPSINPATGVKTPTLPTVTTRNEGNLIVNRGPVSPQGGAKNEH